MINEVFYKILLDNVQDGVYFVDNDRKITYWNKGAEHITGYISSEVVGRPCSDGILMHTDKGGSVLCDRCCPLADTMEDSNQREAEMYLRHKDGHRIPVTVRVAPIHNEQGAVVGGVEVFAVKRRVAAIERLAELERLAYLDPLTGLANRRYAEISLTARLEELQRYDWRFGVIFIDIDNFKDVNDRHGHDVGDEVLKMVAKTLQNSVRSFDTVSRWGGEEYLAIIVHVTREELIATANRCRALVAQSGLPSVPSLRVTISLGATLARHDDTVGSIVKRADELMYQCKAAGRNCVLLDEDSP